MGILRSDRVSGLGGANAINGSVDFSGRSGPSFLRTISDDFAVGTGDFTVEAWYYRSAEGTHADAVGNIIVQTGSTATQQNGIWLADAQGKLEGRVHHGSGSWNLDITSSTTMSNDTWYHVAMSRSGSAVKIFIDGALEASGSSSSDLTTAYSNEAYVGAQGNSPSNRGIIGYVSNARISNTALYTAAFTVPSARLEKLSSTLLLCCQSPGNVLQEATGKTIVTYVDNTNNKGPSASRFSPDVGEDHGTTFTDNTKFDTLSYMVPPGGTTAQRGRGRGLFPGGNNPSYLNNIDYIQIQSLGNAIDFGDAIVTYKQRGSFSSQTRAVSGGGYDGSSTFNVIDYVTMATTGNSSDFGDLTVARRNCVPAANSTRGVWLAGGTPTIVNTIDYITIASAGNATDFGDALDTVGSIGGGSSSPTRAIFAGGAAPAGNTITYLTIATTGNSADFGDILTGVTNKPAGTSSATRGLIICGESQPTGTRLNTIQYVTIASLGNATDFGDNSILQRSMGACSNSLRAVYGGGNGPSTPTALNTLSYVEIATTGNGQDFGDLTTTKSNDSKNCSDSHGGIS